MNATFIQVSINALTDFRGVNLILSSSYYNDISKDGKFLGSIIFESDLSNWVSIFKDDIKNPTMKDIKELGIFVFI